jgi:hypothetical protein
MFVQLFCNVGAVTECRCSSGNGGAVTKGILLHNQNYHALFAQPFAKALRLGWFCEFAFALLMSGRDFSSRPTLSRSGSLGTLTLPSKLPSPIGTTSGRAPSLLWSPRRPRLISLDTRKSKNSAQSKKYAKFVFAQFNHKLVFSHSMLML